MNTRAAIAAAAVLAVIPAGGVTAKPREPRVTVSHEVVRSVPLDAGYLVEVVCVARAEPATTTQVPVVTAVSCAIGDFVQAQAVPGGLAAVTLTSAVTGPFELCVAGEAVFVDPVTGTNPTAEREPRCRRVRP